jgi:hypothetical protein
MMFSTGYLHVSVEDEFYYQSYPQTLRLVSSWSDWHRILITERIAYTDYKDQGSAPSSTSREGVSNALNVTNHFYFDQKKDLDLALGYEYKAEDTEGSNYVRNTHQFGADFNFPMWRDWGGRHWKGASVSATKTSTTPRPFPTSKGGMTNTLPAPALRSPSRRG